MGWDALNRLTSISSTTDNWGADGFRQSLATSSGTTYYLNDGGTPVVEFNSSGTATAFNLVGADGIIGRETNPGGSGTWAEYVFDILGNTAIRTDGSGNAVAAFGFDGYGGFSAAPTSTGVTSTTPDPWMYNAQSGYYYDTSTQAYLCGHRFYDWSLCRWLNRDPIGYAGGTNLYGYCGGNPIGRADPGGTIWGVDDVAAAAEGVVEGAVAVTEAVADAALTLAEDSGAVDFVSAHPEIINGAEDAASFTFGDNPLPGQALSEAESGTCENNPGEFQQYKPGSSGGPGEGKLFSQSMLEDYKASNPNKCFYCRMEGELEGDHIIPRSQGGNNTIENLQLACRHCNASKWAGPHPLSAPFGYLGDWPAPWWYLDD